MSEDDGPSSKDLYHKVLSCIAHNTANEYQRPSMLLYSLKGTLCAHAGYDPERVDQALRVADRQHDDILTWRGRDGRPRVCLTDDETLLALIEHEAEQEHPNEELIAEASKRRTDTWESDRAHRRRQ